MYNNSRNAATQEVQARETGMWAARLCWQPHAALRNLQAAHWLKLPSFLGSFSRRAHLF